MKKAHQLVIGSDATLDLEVRDINNQLLEFDQVTDVAISFVSKSNGAILAVAKLNDLVPIKIVPVVGQPGIATIELPASATEDASPGTIVLLQLTIYDGAKKYTVPAEMVMELIENHNLAI